MVVKINSFSTFFDGNAAQILWFCYSAASLEQVHDTTWVLRHPGWKTLRYQNKAEHTSKKDNTIWEQST